MLGQAHVDIARQRISRGEPVESVGGLFLSRATVHVPDEGADPGARERRGWFTQPARIFGTPDIPSCMDSISLYQVGDHPAAFIEAEGARVVGWQAVLTADRALHAPRHVTASGLEEMLLYNREGREGFMAEVTDGALECVFASRRVPRRHRMRALFLPNAEPVNYGSFMFRQLPQLVWLRERGLAFECYITERTAWIRDAIAAMGLPERPILSPAEVSGDVFDRIGFLSYPDAEGYLARTTRLALLELARRIRAERAAAGPTPARIFVSRALSEVSKPHYRPLTNAQEIEEMFAARGYAVVHPETLSFAEQVRLFAGARAIVGLSGSGMLNAGFANVGTTVVDIESYADTVRQHAKFYASCGLNYAFAFGSILDRDRPIFSPWTLAPEIAEAVLAWVGD